MAYKIKRVRRVLEKARRNGVSRLREGVYLVTSATSGQKYVANLNLMKCTCERQQYIGERNGYVNACSHIQAATIHRWLEQGYHLVARATDDDVRHLHRKVVYLSTEGSLVDEDGQPISDGVKFTARVEANAEDKRERHEQVRPIDDNALDDLARINEELYG